VKKIVACTFLSVMWSSTLWAQCATGVNTGGGNCIPPDADGMPGYNASGYNAPPHQPAPVWNDRWGAIAFDRGTGQAGTVVDKDSKRDAVNSAMHDCQINGSPNCEVVLTYYNACAAIAMGGGGSGMSNNATLEGAKNGAMRTCSEDSTTCKIVYSGCSLPRRIK
jgi:hypothetical protein